jgi:hypothetical protein
MEQEIYLPEDINETQNEVELTKPRKKKVYTKPKTQKQLENFNKAKSIRYEQIKQKKLEDQKQLIQQVLDTEKKIKKSMKQQEVKPEVKITEYDDNKSSSESSDEEIIIKSKPKTKPKKSKKKTVIYLSETESESESEPEPIKKPKSRIQRNNINQVEPEQKNIIKPIEYKKFFI